MSATVNLLLDKLRTVETRYEELNQQLADPDIVSDSKRYQKAAKTQSELGELVAKFREYKDLEHGISETQTMLREETDMELKAMAQEELAGLEQRLAQCDLLEQQSRVRHDAQNAFRMLRGITNDFIRDSCNQRQKDDPRKKLSTERTE